MHPDMPIDTVMRDWPATIQVVLKYRMLCVGCPVGSFHSIREACRAHGLDEDTVMAELRRAVEREAELARSGGLLRGIQAPL